VLTFYCPKCWEIVEKTDRRCPHCGFDLTEFNQLAFEDKLLAALHHSVAERKMMAAQILGNIGSLRALPVFFDLVTQPEMDYFFMRAVLLAAAKIDHPDRDVILQKASEHPSELIANLAKELLAQLSQQKDIGKWDRHTG
jgi:hypothetical protein